MAKKKKSPDPYKTLGVPRTVNKESVKRAYRRKARQAHPDSGGSQEEFQQVNNAYRLLMDDRLRTRYDETGETEESGPDNRLNEMALVLAQVFAAVMEKVLRNNKNPLQENMVELMKCHIGDLNLQLGDGISQLRTIVETLKKVASHFKEGEENDLMKALANRQVVCSEAELQRALHQEELNKQALDHLNKCGYKPDPKPQSRGSAGTWNGVPISVVWGTTSS